MKNRNKCSDSDSENLLLQHEIEVMEGILDTKVQYRKVVKAAIGKWVKDFQSGDIEIKTVDDLKKLIELDIELQKDEL
ncbi:conserved hypothetical protein [Brevibacillus brevis NBRC 100599]|uniref:Uncharacterized protein n=1 Tax=Brevibacillus brevis (strain 47 / JCM 6285 / NBRC 100599) TaxID=358681 RepID=C0ZFG5_BREBN|nr:hypothetical protein [Brevibacillus brevis]BAH44524.1 conserved hypothetical protein [Brevibacillus brevis NBRC 100599]